MKSRVIERNMFYGAEARTFEAARMPRKNMTLAELILWKKLRDRTIFKTRSRRQEPFHFFIADFYLHEHKLVIEIDGEIHNNQENIEYDLGRTAELEKLGIKVLRFSNDQIIFKMDSVIDKILLTISELTPL